MGKVFPFFSCHSAVGEKRYIFVGGWVKRVGEGSLLEGRGRGSDKLNTGFFSSVVLLARRVEGNDKEWSSLFCTTSTGDGKLFFSVPTVDPVLSFIPLKISLNSFPRPNSFSILFFLFSVREKNNKKTNLYILSLLLFQIDITTHQLTNRFFCNISQEIYTPPKQKINKKLIEWS